MPAPPANRQPCAYCGAAGRWPDRCTEEIPIPCGESIAESCADYGDHRRCVPDTCEFSALWHPAVIAAGVAACDTAGQPWAVVSVLGGRVRLVGTINHLGRAKSLLRTGALRRAGLEPVAPHKHLVVVVSRDGWIY